MIDSNGFYRSNNEEKFGLKNHILLEKRQVRFNALGSKKHLLRSQVIDEKVQFVIKLRLTVRTPPKNISYIHIQVNLKHFPHNLELNLKRFPLFSLIIGFFLAFDCKK